MVEAQQSAEPSEATRVKPPRFWATIVLICVKTGEPVFKHFETWRIWLTGAERQPAKSGQIRDVARSIRLSNGPATNRLAPG